MEGLNAPRRARPSEREQVRELMTGVYHDSDAFNDLFFNECYRVEDSYVTTDTSGRVVATCMMLPCRFIWRGRAYHAGMNYAAAVREGYHRLGLIKAIMLMSNDELAAAGASHAVGFINPSANKPWQSIGYTPAFPLEISTVGYEDAPADGVRAVEPGDARALSALDALYERAFQNYAHWARGEKEWAFLVKEYALDGGALMLARDGAIEGYCVYTIEDGGLTIKECVANDARGEKSLRAQAMRVAGAREARVWKPARGDASRAVAAGIIKRIAPGGMPDFPYEKGYLNLFHM